MLGVRRVGLRRSSRAEDRTRPKRIRRPLCWLVHPVPDGGMIRNLRAEEWADLVVRELPRRQRERPRTASATTVQWRETDDDVRRARADDERRPRARSPVNEESVIVGRGDTRRAQAGVGHHPPVRRRRRVWSRSMLTERDDEGVAVRAIGNAPHAGRAGAPSPARDRGWPGVVVADGERCPDEDEERVTTIRARTSRTATRPARRASRPVSGTRASSRWSAIS